LRVYKPILGILTVCLLVIAAVAKLNYIVRPYDTDIAYSQVETFHNLPPNSIEVIIYGSSHALTGIAPLEMYDKYGIGAYNYSCFWQRMNTTRAFVEDSLMDQTPKIALIECVHAGLLYENVDIQPEIYYSRYLKDKEAKKEYLTQCFGNDIERYVSYYVPLYSFHDNWNALSKTSFEKLSVDTSYRESMGYMAVNVTEPIIIPVYESLEQWGLDESAIKNLDKIVEACHKKNVNVIFYTAPYQAEHSYGEALEKYANDNNCVYIDLFKNLAETGINEKTDFFDDGHLNISGANKAADYLGKYIVDNYDITDMRTIKNNLWER